jgi:long-subunit acyl-CoA synthetase (AMP-forming)
MDDGKILAERADIERQVAGRTLCDLIDEHARRHPDAPAASSREAAGWATLSWSQARERVRAVAAGLAGLGVRRGDFVALMMANRAEHVIADQAAVYLGAVPTTLYGTLAEEQIRFCAGHCGARVAIVDDAALGRRWAGLRADLPALEHLVLRTGADGFTAWPGALGWAELVERGRDALAADPDALAGARGKVRAEDPATVVYTSGTTGPPKGVVLTHHNLLYECAAIDRFAELPDELTAVSYLPLAHIAERLGSIYYNWLFKRGHVYFCPELAEVFDYVRDVRPLTFAGVPRVWEKLWSGLVAGLDAAPPRRRRLAHAALASGRAVVRLSQAGERVPLRLRARHAVLDRVVLARIRAATGLDRATNLVSGAAPLAVDVAESFAALGLPIHEVYGMTETSGIATANRHGALRIGTVGPAVTGIEVRLAGDGEVLVRGPINTPGYHRDPVATAELVDPDGWLHTGDVGALEPSGHLRIVDRKKELIITAGGKNISPANIENMLKEHPLIGQCIVYGNGRPYLVALVVLDGQGAPAWAAQHGIADATVAALAAHPRVARAVLGAVEAVNGRLSRPEQIKRLTILSTEWTPEGDELTPTLKLRRARIHAKYASDIEGLYAASSGLDVAPVPADLVDG